MKISRLLKSKKYIYPLGTLLLIGSFLAGLAVQSRRDSLRFKNEIRTIKPIRENNLSYQFIYPLLAYDLGKIGEYFRNDALELQLRAYINQQLTSKNADQVSIYAKDFIDNTQAGVNENTRFEPGSLLKVAILIAYYKQAETEPAILDKNFTYTKENEREINSVGQPLPSSLNIGSTYSVPELLKKMITESDNGAESILINNVSRAVLDQTFIDLKIPNPDTASEPYAISPREYAALLRILYNSTYLTEASSESALSIMTQSTYTAGIRASVPQNIPVAQKYGERLSKNSDGSQAVELHDCGIVYHPHHPYVICIMTRGRDPEKLAHVIAGASKIVYTAFDTRP